MNYATPEQWQTGFGAQLSIANPSSTAIIGWRLTWTFGGNQRIGNLWNGTFTQSGAAVTVTNAPYNAAIGSVRAPHSTAGMSAGRFPATSA